MGVKSYASVRNFQRERHTVTKCRQILIEVSERTSMQHSGISAGEPLYVFLPAFYDANEEKENDTSDKSGANNRNTDKK